jgi:hypothetical protein
MKFRIAADWITPTQIRWSLTYPTRTTAIIETFYSFEAAVAQFRRAIPEWGYP